MQTKDIIQLQLKDLVQNAENHRDETSISALQEYVNQHPVLFQETSELDREIEERITHYLASGDEQRKARIKLELKLLRQQLMESNDLIDQILVSELVLSYAFHRFSQIKLLRHYEYSGASEAKKAAAIQSNFIKALKLYKTITGKVPSFEINLSQFNQNLYQTDN